MNRFREVAVLVCIIFISSLVLIPLANADWTMFRANPSHSGVGTGNPVLTPTLLWNFTAGYQVESSPAVFGGIVYVGSTTVNYTEEGYYGLVPNEYGCIYALNATSGAQIWNYPTGDDIFSCPAITNGVVYVTAGFDGVYALNASSGVKIWKYPSGNSGIISSPAIVNGVVYFGSADGNVYAVNSSSGAKLWNYTVYTYTEGYYGVNSSPAVVKGVVYVGSNDGTFTL